MQPINRHEAMGLLDDLVGECGDLQEEIEKLSGLYDADRNSQITAEELRAEKLAHRRRHIELVRDRAVLIASDLSVLVQREYVWPTPRKYEDA